MTALPIHYYLDAAGAVFVWVVAWRLRLGQVTMIPGLRIGQPKDPEALASNLALPMALMPVSVIATDTCSLIWGDGRWWYPVINIGAVLLIASWIFLTIRAAQK